MSGRCGWRFRRLLDQLELSPTRTLASLIQQAADYQAPQLSVPDLLLKLERIGAIEFAAAVGRHIDQ